MCFPLLNNEDRTFICAILLFVTIIFFTVLTVTSIDTFVIVAYMCIFFIVQNISIMISTRIQLRCYTEELLQENERQFQQIRKLHTQRCKMSDEYWDMEKKFMVEGQYWKSRCINMQIGRRHSSSGNTPTQSPNLHSLESHSENITSTQHKLVIGSPSSGSTSTQSPNLHSLESHSENITSTLHKLEIEQDIAKRSKVIRRSFTNSFP